MVQYGLQGLVTRPMTGQDHGGFRPMQDPRPHRKPLRSAKLCWSCDRPTVGFVQRRGQNDLRTLDLPEPVCGIHLFVCRAHNATWATSGNPRNVQMQFDNLARWKHATKSNPYGYLYGLTTPEEYVAYKDYYKRFWLRYMLGRTSDASA